jgi:hypothetical protein
MIRDGLDCETIREGYLRSICEGTSWHSEAEAAAYRQLWLTGEGTPLAQQPIDLACVHRGDRAGDLDCLACGGKHVTLFVFACAVHGRCLMGSPRDGLAGCIGCPDRQAP